MGKINENGLNLIKQWEGLRLEAYRDVSGVWTIGYGHTAAAGAPHPKAGMKIDERAAQDILLRDLSQYEQMIAAVIKVPLSDNQFAALVSFCYNIGTGAFIRSTLCKRLNEGDYDAVPQELSKWIHVNGHKIAGLVNRRAAEAGLWARGEFVASNYLKPEKSRENSFCKPEAFAPLIGAASGLGSVISGEGVVQYALAFTMVVACLLGAWWFVRRMRRQEA